MSRAPWLILPAVILVCLALALLAWGAETGGAEGLLSSDVAQASAGETPTVPEAKEADSCPQLSAYPTDVQRWCALLVPMAAKYGLEVNMLAALMLEESGGDPLAYSPSGAVGLLQVMPRDGVAADFQCPAGPCFASRPTIAELQDPAFNLETGARMLAGLTEKLGDLREALHAYGPMDVGYRYAETVLAIRDRYR